MHTALIIHGACDREEYFSDQYPSPSNSHWLPWIQKQLLTAGYLVQTPEMPSPYEPKYKLWQEEFEHYSVSSSSLLIGHSCGAGFLLRWLSETQIKVRRLILVAPWLDPEGTTYPDFFNFEIDPNITNRADVHLLESSNDAADIQNSVAKIRQALPLAKCHVFKNYGHFCFSNMGTSEFPELKEIALLS